MGSSRWFSRYTVSDLIIRRHFKASSVCRLLLQAKHPLLVAFSGSLLVSGSAWGETIGQSIVTDAELTKTAKDFMALAAKNSQGLQTGRPEVDIVDHSLELFRSPANVRDQAIFQEQSSFLAKPGRKASLLSLTDSRRAADLDVLSGPSSSPSASKEVFASWSFTEAAPLLGWDEQNLSPTDFQQMPFAEPWPRDRDPSLAPAAGLTSTATVSLAAGDPNSPSIVPVPSECRDPDPELGCLRLQNVLPGAAMRTPILYLIPRLDFYRSDNVLSGIDPVDDGLMRPGVTLLAFPQLGPNTFLNAAVEAGFSRYFKVSQFSYDELRLRAGIFQRLSPTMSAEIGWSNQQLFIASDRLQGFPRGTRFLNDQAVRFELSRRDQLTKKLSLNSFYQFRVGFAVPAIRSRIINVAFLSLNYDFNANLQLGLDYQLALANYTQVVRTDLYQQILGRITYNAFRNTQLSVYSGYSFGNSTEPGINFNSFILGVSVTVNIVLF